MIGNNFNLVVVIFLLWSELLLFVWFLVFELTLSTSRLRMIHWCKQWWIERTDSSISERNGCVQCRSVGIHGICVSASVKADCLLKIKSCEKHRTGWTIWKIVLVQLKHKKMQRVIVYTVAFKNSNTIYETFSWNKQNMERTYVLFLIYYNYIHIIFLFFFLLFIKINIIMKVETLWLFAGTSGCFFPSCALFFFVRSIL